MLSPGDGLIGTGLIGAGLIGGPRANHSAYFEQSDYVGSLSTTCGTIRTDGIVAQTVRDLPVTYGDSLFPVAADASDANLSPYTGTQTRDETFDAIQALMQAATRDNSAVPVTN